MISRAHKKGLILTAILLGCCVPPALAAEIDENQTIGLFSGEEPVEATSPIPRPTSRIAENVTVITADDIVRLNAHTLAEVLQTVAGIQLDVNPRTPGTFTFFNIQGALNSTVLVLIDGIRQNDYDQNMLPPGLISVQQIERIEIVKGAASGAWGSALGGVVNIVTKTPNPDAPVSGMVSSSVGSRFTSDSRAELSGSKDRVGYYLTAGHIRSDGLSPNTDSRLENLYGKLSYALPSQGAATFGISRQSFEGGQDEGEVRGRFVQQDGENRHDYLFLKFQQPLAHRFSLDVMGYLRDFDDRVKNTLIAGGAVFSNKFSVNDSSRGLNGSVSWGDSENNLVLGGEYAHVHAGLSQPGTVSPPIYDRRWDSYAGYCNGAYAVGPVTIVPGIRFDSTGFAGDHLSYSLGLTYRVARETTLRAYWAKGFALPMLGLDTGAQKVNTLQTGVETGAVPYLWLKGTFFHNSLKNTESVGPIGSVTATDQERQGFELEARTIPLYGFSLSGAYTYLDAEDSDTGKKLKSNGQQSVPPQVYKLALRYDHDPLGLRGSLTGSGTVWNADPGYPARAKGMVWDLNLSWKPGGWEIRSPELFFTAHNLFDAIQSTSTILQTDAPRWYEGGARFAF